jgi:transcriptional regulator with XRE-family HTH domain
MKLIQYLIQNEISQKKLAELLQVSQPTVHKWLNNKAVPSGKKLVLIERLTDGEVGARDFFNGKA